MAKINFYRDYPDTSVPDNSEIINETIMAVLQILGLDVDTYNTATEYEVDDFVVYEHLLWCCIEATTGTWNEDKWEKDSILKSE